MTERLHFHFSLSCIGEGNGNPLQCSCLENPRDGGTWWAAVYGIAQSRTRLKGLSSSSSRRYPVSSGGSDGKESACNAREPGSIPGWEDPLEKEWLPTPVFLPGESHGQNSLMGYNPWGHQESDMTEGLTDTHEDVVKAVCSSDPAFLCDCITTSAYKYLGPVLSNWCCCV